MPKGLFVLDPLAFELAYGIEGRAEIARRVELLAEPLTRDAIAASPGVLGEAEVIFTGWGAPRFDEALLTAAPKLSAVFYGAGSIKQFTTEEFWARGIAVTSAYAVNAIPVAEYTLATLLFSLKHGWNYIHTVKRLAAYPKRWRVPGVYKSKVGLISLGTIGRLVRERLRAFEVEVWAYDPFLTTAEAAALGVRPASLDEMFRHCDVVSLHAPWLKETEGMLGAEHFEAMKPGATFINTARGILVREKELIAVLQRRPDLTAVLDVTWPEPPPAGSPLYAMPNVVLTPHIAGSQDRECRRLGQAMIEELDRWLRGEPMKWVITRERAAVMA